MTFLRTWIDETTSLMNSEVTVGSAGELDEFMTQVGKCLGLGRGQKLGVEPVTEIIKSEKKNMDPNAEFQPLTKSSQLQFPFGSIRYHANSRYKMVVT